MSSIRSLSREFFSGVRVDLGLVSGDWIHRGKIIEGTNWRTLHGRRWDHGAKNSPDIFSTLTRIATSYQILSLYRYQLHPELARGKKFAYSSSLPPPLPPHFFLDSVSQGFSNYFKYLYIWGENSYLYGGPNGQSYEPKGFVRNGVIAGNTQEPHTVANLPRLGMPTRNSVIYNQM